MKRTPILLFFLFAFMVQPMITSVTLGSPAQTNQFLTSSEGLIEDVPYVWQEINGFCGWAAASIAFQAVGLDINMYDVFAASTIGFSYAYVHYNDTILTYPGAIYTQAEPLDFIADLFGVNYTIYLSENLYGVDQYEQYWESIGINVGLLGGEVEAFDLMRKSIDTGYPLMISVDPIFLPQSDYDVLRQEDTTGGAHGVVIVGYNDTTGFATIMDPGVGSFGDNFGYPTDGRGSYVEISYTALNSAWAARSYISNLLKPYGSIVSDFSNQLGPMIRDKLLGVGSVYAPGSSSAYLWDYGEKGFRKMSEDFSVDGLTEYFSIFDGIDNEVPFKTSILLFMGLGLETSITLQYLSFRKALDVLPSLMSDIDLDNFVAEAEQALPHMESLSSNATLINPNNLTVIDGLLSTTFYDMSVMFNDTGDLALTLAEYSEELNEISTHFLGIADGWLAAGNALVTIWSNDPFVLFGPWILVGTAGVVITILYVIYYMRGKPSQ